MTILLSMVTVRAVAISPAAMASIQQVSDGLRKLLIQEGAGPDPVPETPLPWSAQATWEMALARGISPRSFGGRCGRGYMGGVGGAVLIVIVVWVEQHSWQCGVGGAAL